MIAGRLPRTPLLEAAALGECRNCRVYLKAELFQRTGSFKPRGVLNKLATLSREERGRGIIAASAGNHAAALAYGAAIEGIDCLVVTWRGASEVKIGIARGYGATVDREVDGPDVVFDRLAELRDSTGRTDIHAYDDPLVIAGQGTVGLEIIDELRGVDVVLVPTGGAGLVSGIAQALPETRVVACEPEEAPTLARAIEAGKPVTVTARSVADGLNAPIAGPIGLEICRAHGVESVLVTEEEIRAGFRFLYEREKLAAEPAGAAGVAALLANRVPDIEGKTIAIVVSGGNVAAKTASAILTESEA